MTKHYSLLKIITSIVLSMAGLLGAQFVIGFVIAPLLDNGILSQNVGGTIFIILYNLTAFSLIYLIVRYLLKAKMSDFSFSWNVKPIWILTGILLPLFIMLVITIIMPGHWAAFGGPKSANDWFQILVFVGLYGSIIEELVFRALIFNLLRRRLTTFPAALLSGILFAIIHVVNPVFEGPADFAIFVISSCSIGILFAYITEHTKSVWNAAWIHLMWNILATTLINISEKADKHFIFNYVLTENNKLITGGDPGLTGSFITVFACLALSVLLASRLNKNQQTV